MQSSPGVIISRHRHVAKALGAALLMLFASQTALAGGVPKQTFPRIAGYQIGKTPYTGYDDPEYHRQIARLDLAIIGSSSTARNADAAAIRRLNPNIVLLKYMSLQSVSSTFGGYSEIKRDKIASERGPNQTNAHDWWARDYNGNNVSNWPNNWTVNITRYVQPDANGDRFPEWVAKGDYERWLKYEQWDGVFEDAVYWVPRRTSSGAAVDWSGGKETNTAKINSEFRLGHQAYWNKTKSLAPGKFIMVNHDWYRSESESALGRWDLPEFDKQVHGGILENVMSSSDLVQPRTAWVHVMQQYQRSMKYFLDPGFLVMHVRGEANNYRFFRYAFATCLMNDGHINYTPLGEFQYGSVEWFDEYDLAGSADTEWLGLAIDPPPTSAWRSGVWRRDFEGGVALVNPKGNGAQTVTVEEGLNRIAGQQDRQVNNGQPADRITLQDGDGIVLVRDSFVAAPPPSVETPKPPVLH